MRKIGDDLVFSLPLLHTLPLISCSFPPLSHPQAAIKEHASEALGRSLAIFNQYELVDSTRLDDL